MRFLTHEGRRTAHQGVGHWVGIPGRELQHDLMVLKDRIEVVIVTNAVEVEQQTLAESACRGRIREAFQQRAGPPVVALGSGAVSQFALADDAKLGRFTVERELSQRPQHFPLVPGRNAAVMEPQLPEDRLLLPLGRGAPVQQPLPPPVVPREVLLPSTARRGPVARKAAGYEPKRPAGT